MGDNENKGKSPSAPVPGEPDKDLVLENVTRAYEEAKRKREKYKRIGPAFVLISGVIFLTLIFTLENKITFLIFWVITILYTVALMIRTEYKYNQFRGYLGLSDSESAQESTADETAEVQSGEPADNAGQKADTVNELSEKQEEQK